MKTKKSKIELVQEKLVDLEQRASQMRDQYKDSPELLQKLEELLQKERLAILSE